MNLQDIEKNKVVSLTLHRIKKLLFLRDDGAITYKRENWKEIERLVSMLNKEDIIEFNKIYGEGWLQ